MNAILDILTTLKLNGVKTNNPSLFNMIILRLFAQNMFMLP